MRYIQLNIAMSSGRRFVWAGIGFHAGLPDNRCLKVPALQVATDSINGGKVETCTH
jgi:hypothetical protein